jgi:hypothetical protein
MTETNAPIPFALAVPKTPQEPDRFELKGDECITITGLLISTKTKYDKLAKINGIVDGNPTKFRTTSETLVRDCENIIKYIVMKTPAPITPQDVEKVDKIAIAYDVAHVVEPAVKVTIKNIRSKSGHDYLKME